MTSIKLKSLPYLPASSDIIKPIMFFARQVSTMPLDILEALVIDLLLMY